MTEFDFEEARYNMIEQQVRTWDVLDQQVLDVMAAVPRERFVPASYRHLAYADVEVPMGQGQVLLSPKVVGRILQALNVRAEDAALEIGTGTGYVAASLARLAHRVVSVEIVPELHEQAGRILTDLGDDNIALRVGDAASGWAQDGTFDAIAVTGSVPVLPEAMKHQLNVGGRMFVVVGEAPIMEALLITRMGEDDWVSESLFDTVLPPLQNAVRPHRFVF